MRPLRLNNLSIGQRVLLLALLPMVLITLCLSGYMINSRISQEKNTLLEHSRVLANYLATGAEFGLFAENTDALKALSKGLIAEDAISDVLFVNADRKVVYQHRHTDISDIRLLPHIAAGGPQPQPLPQPLLQGTDAHHWALQAPVINSALRIDDYEQPPLQPQGAQGAEQHNTLLGWVVLIINEQSLQARQQHILLSGLAITLTGLALAAWLALGIGRGITRPIKSIIETIEQLGNEQLAARVNVDSGGELGELQRGINSLADRVQHNRLRLEDEVRSATDDLQQTLHQLEQQNRQLDSARHKAETANQAKDTFLARMSHELRTPLTSIIGFSELLNKTEQNREQQEYVDIIGKTSAILLQIIDDILDFSKLQSHAIKLESIPFDLDKTIEEILDMQAPLANEKRLQLHFITDPALPGEVRGDPTRIRQIITNLVTNAIKFTEQGDVTVRLYCERLTHLINLRIEVQDSGIGIAKHRQQELFQPFSQADSSITRRFGGSGLGLVICRYLMDLMNGTIELDSNPGQGTRISLKLQLPANTSTAVELPLKDKRILLLDLATSGSSQLHSALRHWQLDVQHCHQQRDFLTRLQQDRGLDAVLINLGQAQRHTAYYLQIMRRIRSNNFQGPVIFSADSDPVARCAQTTHQIRVHQPVFCLKMPLTYGKLLTALAPEATLPPPQLPLGQQHRQSPQPLRGAQLLVAEDNRFNRVLLQRVLQRAGAHITLVSDGAAAVEQATAQHYDCILMDVHMPQMNGIDASQLIVARTARQQGPIIALTANIVANEAEALQQAGVTTTLFKPIREAPLLQAISQALDSGNSSATEREQQPDTAIPDTRLRLSDYGISDEELYRELHFQLTAIHRGCSTRDRILMREHSHQLIGLAGLLDLEQLEATADSFNRILKTGTWRQVWENIWRLQRVINRLLEHD